MPDRAIRRLHDIKFSIEQIRRLLHGQSVADLQAEPVVRAAFERFLEILSEASRHVPHEWKIAVAPDVPWQQVRDLGNVIRHAYNRVDAKALWSVYEDDLDQLEAAVEALLSAYDHRSD